MDFSIEALHSLEKDMQTALQQLFKTVKISSISELSHPNLVKLQKDPLATLVKNFVNLFDKNMSLCKAAASTIDQLKSEQINSQQEMIKVQRDQLKSVNETVKTEIKTWADVAKQNSDQNLKITAKTVKEAVHSARSEDEKSINIL